MITQTSQRRRCNLRALVFSLVSGLLVFGLMVQMRHYGVQDISVRIWLKKLYRYHGNETDQDMGGNSTNNSSDDEIQYYVSQGPGNYDNRRLGNQLFNFAAALYVAKRSNDRRALPPDTGNVTLLRKDRVVAMPKRHPHGWLDQWFDVKVARYDNHKDGITNGICPCAGVGETGGLRFCHSLDKQVAGYQLKSPPIRSLVLDGWFQSWMYTVGVEDELRRHLQFTKNISDVVDEYFEETRPCRFNISLCAGLRKFRRIGIHVRRADILEPSKVSYGYTVVDRHYLKKAMQYFANTTELVQYIVVSDDLKWTKSAIKKNGPIKENTDVVYSSPDSPAAVDLAILSRCDGVIMTTGTYGWWGAWLSNKTVIYYGNWPRPGSQLDGLFSKQEFFPPHWIPMT